MTVRALLACIVAATLGACSPGSHAPASSRAAATVSPAPGAPYFAGAPPARMVLDARPLDVDPAGNARFLVRARFIDASGAPTELVRGGNVDFLPSSGTAQWQTRMRFGGPAAIVSLVAEGRFVVRVRADVGARVPDARIVLDTHSLRDGRVVARALGPHSVWIGWFPRLSTSAVAIARTSGRSTLTIATVAPPSSGYRDDTVLPGHTYRYALSFANRAGAVVRATVPAPLPRGSIDAASGKGVWLSFSPSKLDDDGYDRLVASDIVARAKAAGLHAIDVRTTYGPFREITSADAPSIDALIDAAAENGIAAVAWTVPRSTSFEDLAAEVSAAAYRTARGNGFEALAVDLERGEYFLGNGSAGFTALASYTHLLRAAIGPRYPIIATVEDPNLEGLTNADYPFAAIARDANVLQPMVYWRAALRAGYPAHAVTDAISRSYRATQRASGANLPMNVGLQTSSQGSHGAPPPKEIEAAIARARALGAVGVTCFDWNGTAPGAWRAIASARY